MNYSFDELFDSLRRIEHKVDAIEKKTQGLGAITSIAPPESDLTDMKGASSEIGKAVATIYGMVSRNEIPFMKRGKKLYFSRQELQAWVKGTRNKTVDESKAEVRTGLGKIKQT